MKRRSDRASHDYISQRLIRFDVADAAEEPLLASQRDKRACESCQITLDGREFGGTVAPYRFDNCQTRPAQQFATVFT